MNAAAGVKIAMATGPAGRHPFSRQGPCSLVCCGVHQSGFVNGASLAHQNEVDGLGPVFRFRP